VSREWKKRVTLPELQAMSGDQIVQNVNELLVPTPSVVSNLDSGDVAAAQFYTAELNRREDQRVQAERDQIETER
jgi:hypothetical protein